MQFNVINPKPASIYINAHLVQHELVCHYNCLSALASGIICKVESSTNEIDVALEHRDIGTVRHCFSKQLFHSRKFVELSLEVDVVNPYFALALSVESLQQP